MARVRKPLDPTRLEELALAYVARFASSGAKLARYLDRKLYERGWEGEGEPDVSALVRRFAENGYIDDEAYARAKAGDLLRRGYGGRRVKQALGQAGIAEDIREEVAPGEAAARHAVLRMAQKRRFGPFAPEPPDRDKREKHLAAMLRAGHSLDMARQMLDAPSEEAAQEWAVELDEEEVDDGSHW